MCATPVASVWRSSFTIRNMSAFYPFCKMRDFALQLAQEGVPKYHMGPI